MLQASQLGHNTGHSWESLAGGRGLRYLLIGHGIADVERYVKYFAVLLTYCKCRELSVEQSYPSDYHGMVQNFEGRVAQ